MSVTVVRLGIIVSVVRPDRLKSYGVAVNGSDQNLASAQLVSSGHWVPVSRLPAMVVQHLGAIFAASAGETGGLEPRSVNG